jgi:hypothetical protein
MQNKEFIRENVYCADKPIHCFPWSSVVAGALVGLGLGFLLHLFGMGIGLTAYHTSAEGAMVLAIGGFLGLLVGAFATMFTAGFTSGYFAKTWHTRTNCGAAYGFVAWSLSIFLAAILMSNIGNYMARFNGMTAAQTSSATSSEMKATANEVASRVPPASSATTQGERNVRAMGLASLAGFIIFFVGAFAAAIGGYCGVECRNKKCRQESNLP